MEQRRFGNLGDISSLPLGGGALARSGAPTSHEEAVATVKAAADWGINFSDAASTYGDGKAEDGIGRALGGRLPDGVLVSTK